MGEVSFLWVFWHITGAGAGGEGVVTGFREKGLESQMMGNWWVWRGCRGRVREVIDDEDEMRI